MRSWFQLFVFVSLFFIAIALYKADYLRIPAVLSFPDLIASLIFLFLGLLAAGMCWHKTIQVSGFDVPVTVSIAGFGLSVFGKYIPGKVWTIAGRATYAAE